MPRTKKAADPDDDLDDFELEEKKEKETNGKVKMAMSSVSKANRAALRETEKLFKGFGNRPPDTHYNINVTLSDMTSLDRSLPDTRPEACSRIKYDISKLPKVSIVHPVLQ